MQQVHRGLVVPILHLQAFPSLLLLTGCCFSKQRNINRRKEESRGIIAAKQVLLGRILFQTNESGGQERTIVSLLCLQMQICHHGTAVRAESWWLLTCLSDFSAPTCLLPCCQLLLVHFCCSTWPFFAEIAALNICQ